ncbi:hypothetical protein HH214_18050 [Mucilaginibacter robiniae]|uniref:Uncharacterized protein n=1 Tax=Mucilaginibacter robiniae TaxID=2728022 RepID=A0A7L5E772_9SPHI|nr:hypothetical protein [Mucilaginibacter robiniae]QJD97644.1 hypothetical protein HH214_18050 [Mucilaginibacter robiniae]
MRNFRILLFQFYKPLFFWNLLFSVAGIADLWINGFGQLVGSFIVKFVGYAASVGFQYYFSPQVYYYYHNAGYRLKNLYAGAFALDFFMYLLYVFLFYIISFIGC